jgi:hypothetical protein
MNLAAQIVEKGGRTIGYPCLIDLNGRWVKSYNFDVLVLVMGQQIV